MNTLRKYKKNELIDLLLEYEQEINLLRVDLTSVKLDLDAKNEQNLNQTKEKVVDKTIEYLIKRIRTINDKERKMIYVLELNRIQKT